MIAKNQKTLVDISTEERQQYQLLILIFVLSHNEAIDYATEYNAKRLKKLYPSHLSKAFKFKLEVLNILLDVLKVTEKIEDSVVADLLHMLFKYVMLGSDRLVIAVLQIYSSMAQREALPKDTYRIIATYIIELRNMVKQEGRNTLVNTYEILELCYQIFVPVFSHCLDNTTVKGTTDLLNEDVFDEISLYLQLFISDFQDPDTVAKKQILLTLTETFKSLLRKYNNSEEEAERKMLRDTIHENVSSLIQPVLVMNSSNTEAQQMTFRIVYELLALKDKNGETEFASYQTDLLCNVLSTAANTKAYLQLLRSDWKVENNVQTNAIPFFLTIAASKLYRLEVAKSNGKTVSMSRDKEENECLLEIFKLLTFICLDAKQNETVKTAISGVSLRYYLLLESATIDGNCAKLIKQLMNHQVNQLTDDQKDGLKATLDEAEQSKVYKLFPDAKPDKKAAKTSGDPSSNSKPDDSVDAGNTIQLKKGFGFFKKK